MTPPPRPSPSYWSWHRIVGLLGLLLGLYEAGSAVSIVASVLTGYTDSVALPGFLLLGSLVTLVFPVLLLLSRQRLPSLDYGLAAISPALCASFFLLVIAMVWGADGYPSFVVIFLFLVLPRGAVAAALVSMARHDTRARFS